MKCEHYGRQTIEGAVLPCPDVECDQTQPGESYVVATRDGSKGQQLLFDRELVDDVWRWKLTKATPIDWDAIGYRLRSDVMRRVLRTVPSPEDVTRAVLRAYFDDPSGFRDLSQGNRKRAINAAAAILRDERFAD